MTPESSFLKIAVAGYGAEPTAQAIRLLSRLSIPVAMGAKFFARYPVQGVV